VVSRLSLSLCLVWARQVSTAHFAGVRLRDVLARCGAADLEAAGAAHGGPPPAGGWGPRGRPGGGGRRARPPPPLVLIGHAASLTPY
jgi:hypothetical protein